MFLTTLAAAAIAVCPPAPAKRFECVSDGDGIWIAGEKMRLIDIAAPETHKPKCEAELRLGIKARDRLVVLMNTRPYDLERFGLDPYGRRLVRVGDLGEVLVREGLATRWPKRRDWCR
jgi:micrococcal nuclease